MSNLKVSKKLLSSINVITDFNKFHDDDNNTKSKKISSRFSSKQPISNNYNKKKSSFLKGMVKNIYRKISSKENHFK